MLCWALGAHAGGWGGWVQAYVCVCGAHTRLECLRVLPGSNNGGEHVRA